MADLTRADRIMKHEKFLRAVRLINESEKDRIYCRHGVEHLLDVARAGAMIADERDYDLETDIIYAAALMHDIGRAKDYEDGTPHDQGSVMLAGEILPECGYNDDEVAQIVMAVAAHRMENIGMPLAEVLYEADKKTRLCFMCDAKKTCKWPRDKMNMELVY